MAEQPYPKRQKVDHTEEEARADPAGDINFSLAIPTVGSWPLSPSWSVPSTISSTSATTTTLASAKDGGPTTNGAASRGSPSKSTGTASVPNRPGGKRTGSDRSSSGAPTSGSLNLAALVAGSPFPHSLDGFSNVVLVSKLFDDVVSCCALPNSSAGGQLVEIRFSLSAFAGLREIWKKEADMLDHLRKSSIDAAETVATSVEIVQNNRYGSILVLSPFQPPISHPPLSEETPTTLLPILKTAIGLVTTLDSIHADNLVHASLRPSVITTSPTSPEKVCLSDFSLSFSPLYHSAPRERGMRESSLPYLAPELTGRVPKSADYRADFYSLGAILWEYLTGKPPFSDLSDPMEIIHSHIARRPPALTGIPRELSLIISKLLEKGAEDRYQTHGGLRRDLELCVDIVQWSVTNKFPSPSAPTISHKRRRSELSPVARDLSEFEEDVINGATSGETAPYDSRRPTFTPGLLDTQASFSLPPSSTLFGRSDQLEALASAFQRVQSTGHSEALIIQGLSGIGKSSLVEAAVLKGGGRICCTVKFDQIKSSVPFFALSTALSSLLRQILSEDEENLVKWRAKLSDAMGKEARVLMEALPTLVNVFGDDWVDSLPEVIQLGAKENEERFTELVKRVFLCFSERGKPLVLVFDDLQWSTASDITSILSLSPQSNKKSSILLLCIYRSNEVSDDHVVTQKLLPGLSGAGDKGFHEVMLEPLGLKHVMNFVGDCLNDTSRRDGIEDMKLRRLSELILAKTLGSPLFVAQLLKSFNNDKLFKFNFDTGSWDYDLAVISTSSISTDVVSLLMAQMQKFTLKTQESLKTAACIGNEEIQSAILAQACGLTLPELAFALSDAVEAGLVLVNDSVEGSIPTQNLAEFMDVDQDRMKSINVAGVEPLFISSSNFFIPESYKFFHDRCQQAAYSLIPPTERSSFHYLIGKRLVTSTSKEAIYDHIFDFVNQLNHGISLLSSNDERDGLAEYNYIAATKATKSTAFEAARGYLQTAWDLLGSGGWVAQHDLMSKVTEALVEVEYFLNDYASAQNFARLHLDHSKDTIAKLRVYTHSIRSATAVGDSARAITIGQEGLAMVGITLPNDRDEAAALAKDIQNELHLTVPQIKALQESPRMTDPVLCGAHQILASLIPPIYFTRIDLLSALTSLALKGLVHAGLDSGGCLLLTLYAVLAAGQNQLEASYAYGVLAISFFQKYGGSPLSCPAYKIFSSHVAVWSVPIRETLPTFRQSVAFGLTYRDSEYVGFGCGELCSYSILGGVSLIDVTSDLERFSVLVRRFRNELSTLYIAVIHQAALNLTGRNPDPCEIYGEAFSIDDYQTAVDRNYVLILHLFHMLRLMICLIFRDKKRAFESIKIGREFMHGAEGLVYPTFFQVFEAVILYENFEELTMDQHATLEETTKTLDRLAVSQPTNFEPLRLWLAAERARAKEDWTIALSKYDSAISFASKSQYTHLEAIMNERAAALLKFPKLSAGYILSAHSLWTLWGCSPKLLSLEKESSDLFPPKSDTSYQINRRVSIFSPDQTPTEERPNFNLGGVTSAYFSNSKEDAPASSNSWADLSQKRGSSRSQNSNSGGEKREESVSDRSHPTTHTAHTDIHVRSVLATELDLRTVVSASGVISGEHDVDGIVSKLLGLALRTAGAELCLLVLEKKGILVAEAFAAADSEVRHLRRTDSIDLHPQKYPCKVINYVSRTRTTLVNNVDALGENLVDPYLEKNKPKSILCIALASQQKSVGVLYMENNGLANAFTPDRLEILSLIIGQAASTIEKAQLTQDLKLANTDLQRSKASLEEYNKNLEMKVADRTLQLRQKNELLVAEVSEKERAQAEMRSAKDVAEAATQMKSEFLANMSHEIRTPFNAVVALSGLLLESHLDPVQQDYVETIKNSSQELLVVINDILDYSKIESQRLDLSKDKISVRTCLESSVDMLAERAASKGIELAVVIEEGDIDIISDLTRLRQIVVNLLSNAVKFTSEGEITVTASSQRTDPSPDGSLRRIVTVAVKDSGIGIAKNHFDRLFRVFSQVDGSETTKNFGGTGLGLAISRKLSNLMGGDITVDSEVGKGSTFTLEFVAPCVDPPPVNPYTTAANPGLVGKRALIVDHNSTSRSVLLQLLQSFGIVAEAPEDVNLAYSIAVSAHQEGKAYDLLIVDSFLPNFAAQTLLRRVKKAGVSSAIIALTRMGAPVLDDIRQLDCKCLIKPIKRNRLHHTIRQVLHAGEGISRQSSPHRTMSVTFPVGLALKQPLSILCAEDNPVNVKVITHLLKRLGYAADVAEDGQVAVEKAQKIKYDIILMDVNMPRKDGLEATREICEMMPDKVLRPHIVAMTANAMSGDRENCLNAGCDGYVSKPILVPDLVAALNAAYNKKMSSSSTVTSERPSTSSSISSSF